MKRILSAFIIALTSFSSYAQTNTFPSNANVGIGTLSPLSPLHVNGGTSMSSGWNKTSTLQALYPVQIFNSNATKWAGIGYDHSSALRIWVNATSDDLPGTGLGAVSILNNGNFGIGTFTPTSPLHVTGGAAMSSGWNKTSTLQALYPVQIFNSNATKWAGIGYDHSSALRIWVNAKSDDVSGTGLNAMTISNNGNISIGDFDSQSYKLGVNGTIRAKEIKVETANWPDYVFDPSYQLPDLETTEKFIKQHKHLPEIPAAREVESNGVNLGELNATLVKKIEELTLYMIDINKVVRQQQIEIEQLKSSKNQ